MARRHSDADFAFGAEFNAAIDGSKARGVVSGCEVTAAPDASNDWRVRVASGTILFDGEEVTVAEQHVALTDPSADARYYGLIVLNSTGTASAVEGAEGNPPAAPDLATDRLLLAVGSVDDADPQMASGHVHDARVFVKAVAPGFRGALAWLTDVNGQPAGNLDHTIEWETTEYDTDDFWDVAEPTRLTIPSGVSKVRLRASVIFDWSSVSDFSLDLLQAQIAKNNFDSYKGYPKQRFVNVGDPGAGQRFLIAQVETAPIEVSEGDFFEVYLEYVPQQSDYQIVSEDQTWFAIEVVE